MSTDATIATLAARIAEYAADQEIPLYKVSRDRFKAWAIAMGYGIVSGTSHFWGPAKALAMGEVAPPPTPPEPEPVQPKRPAARAPARSASPVSRGPDRVEKLLIIPDAHAHPQYSQERFAWLGALIADERPDVVVCLGDWADMPALSQYDKGKRGFEGRRYIRDVECTHDALDLVHRGIDYGPELVMCLGNHEARIDRATSDCAELEGTIGVEDLGYAERGWRVVPYLQSTTIGGFAISHHFASGVAGRPIGGMTMAASMARLLFTSAIVGHSHTLDWARRTRPDGSRVVCLVPGCYTAEEQGEETWCRATSHLWWRGVAIMEGVERGDFGELRLISQDSMRAKYGGQPVEAPKDRPLPRLWKGRAA